MGIPGYRLVTLFVDIPADGQEYTTQVGGLAGEVILGGGYHALPTPGQPITPLRVTTASLRNEPVHPEYMVKVVNSGSVDAQIRLQATFATA